MVCPEFEKFKELSVQGNVIPVYREINVDLETPVSIYLKLRNSSESFLFESVEGGEHLARYSFLGTKPSRVLTLNKEHATIRHRNGKKEEISFSQINPFQILRDFFADCRAVEVPGLPRFFGGAVGFFSYDFVRHIERLPETARDELNQPDAVFLLTDTLIAFDHVKNRALLIANAFLEGSDIREAYENAVSRIDALEKNLHHALPSTPVPSPEESGILESNMAPEQYSRMVNKAKEYIAAGDAFQIVLSQRFRRPTGADSFEIYRALRKLNPSPYTFYLDLGDFRLIGSSPEVLVRLEDGNAQLNPIAGTRPRGVDEAEDSKLVNELLNDPKERAEHVMLVDLGRNDLGRVCEYGSVKVPTYMAIEKYSHVIHLVSRVYGKLRSEYDAIDLLRATFPAGTVSGAPKVRAMEIIEELEGVRRGSYAGAVGYFGFPVNGKGNMDFCIAIRTILHKGKDAYLQAGAGVVADSNPLMEHKECENKARALAEAIRLSEEIL